MQTQNGHAIAETLEDASKPYQLSLQASHDNIPPFPTSPASTDAWAHEASLRGLICRLAVDHGHFWPTETEQANSASSVESLHVTSREVSMRIQENKTHAVSFGIGFTGPRSDVQQGKGIPAPVISSEL